MPALAPPPVRHAPMVVHDRRDRAPVRYAPIVVHDRRDRAPLSSVGAAPLAVPGLPPAGPPTTYARIADGGRTIQYWLFYPDNPQDRGIVRTGRHEGDWELVQVGLDARRRPVSVLASQHSGAESCPWPAVRRAGTHPIVYAANGSHAGYLRAGTRDRTWPDPNDEAGGDGRRIRPQVVEVSAANPRWMGWPGRWGASRAGIVPGESDSPRGPSHQGLRWEDPAAFAASAGPCAAGGEPPNRTEDAMTGGAAATAAAALSALVWRRRRRAG